MQNDKVKFKIAEKILVAIILTTIVLSPVLYLIRFSILGIPTTVLEIAIYSLFTFYFLVFSLRKAKFFWPDRKWWWPIGLFISVAMIGVIVSPDKRVALGQFKGFIFDPILLAWVIYFAIRSGIMSAKLVINSLIASGTLIALGSFFLPADISGRALSIYFFDVSPSPNYLALYLAPIVAIALIFVISRQSGVEVEKSLDEIPKSKFQISNKSQNPNFKIFYILASILMTTGVILSGSRGGLLGVGIGTMVGLVMLLKAKVLKIGLTILTILTFLTALWLTRPNLKVSPDSGRVASSNNIRYEIWQTTTEILADNPRNFIFGIGLGNYQNYFTQLTQNRVNYPEFIAPKALTPHNIFLTMWVNGGLLMLTVFIWISVLYFKTLHQILSQNSKLQSPISNEILKPNIQNTKKFRVWSLGFIWNLVLGAWSFGDENRSRNNNRIMAIGLISAMIALLTHGLVDTPYFKNDLSVLFWILVVLCLSTETESIPNAQTQSE